MACFSQPQPKPLMAGSKPFLAIEGGTVTRAAQIVEIVLQEAAINLAHQYSGPITDIISRRQVEEALRKTKTDFAPGPDGITIDLLQLMRTWPVVQLIIFFTNTSLYVQAPIQYKGGSVFLLYKGKGAHIDMDKYIFTCWRTSLGRYQPGHIGSVI